MNIIDEYLECYNDDFDMWMGSFKERITQHKCPNCNVFLWWYPGSWGSYDEPPEPEEYYCNECSWSTDCLYELISFD
jgi:hypothetical protein